MKTFRFVICICLFALCVSMLGGCWQESDSTTGTQGRPPIIGNTEGSTESTGPSATVTVQYLPAEVHNPENLPVLKWVCVTDIYYGGKNRVWSEDAVHELNQMLADKDMPFRVQFIMLCNSDHTLYYDWATEPVIVEALQDADLIYANMTAEQMAAYLSPISEYVSGTAEPALDNAVVHPLNWLQGTIDGEIYAIPTLPSQAVSAAWFFEPEVLDEYGLQISDFQKDFAEMDALFAKIYEANGNTPFLDPGGEGVSYANNYLNDMPNSYSPLIASNIVFNTLHTIGSCFAIDYSTGTPTVVHTLEVSRVREFQEACMRYQEAGYLVSMFEEASIFYISGSTGFDAYTCSNGGIYVPVSKPIFDKTTPYGRVTGVAATSENRDYAVKLLSLIADDEAFRMQLLYGKEGRDYTVSDDGFYCITRQEDGSCYSLDILSPHAYFSGLSSAADSISYESPGTNNWALPETDEYDTLEYYKQTLDNSTVCIPIVFDYSGLEQELAAIQVLIDKYYPVFINDAEIKDDPETDEDEYVPVMDEEGYEYVLQEFKDAGTDRVVAELQRQLEEWLAANPDWQNP